MAVNLRNVTILDTEKEAEIAALQREIKEAQCQGLIAISDAGRVWRKLEAYRATFIKVSPRYTAE